MISVIDAADKETLNFLDMDIFGVRIKAYLNAYGTKEKFLMFWEQRNESGITAAISSLDGDCTLCLTENADFDEINSFVSVVGAKTVFFDRKYEPEIACRVPQSGEVMVLGRKLKSENLTAEEPDYKQIFSLIFDDKSKVDFSFWFTDLSHKIRHNAARAVQIKENGVLIACALSLCETEKNALIGAVAVRENFRRKGYGTSVVTALCGELQKENKAVFLCREHGKNKEFYSRMGFEDCGEWMMAGK